MLVHRTCIAGDAFVQQQYTAIRASRSVRVRARRCTRLRFCICIYVCMHVCTHAYLRARSSCTGMWYPSARSCRGWEFGPWRVPIPSYCARILTLPEKGETRREWGRREKERARRRGHVVSSRSVVILREYLAGGWKRKRTFWTKWGICSPF